MTPPTPPIVVKISGGLLDDDEALDAFWREVRALQSEGPVVIVHGGGAQATAMAQRLDHEPTIVQGRRVTTDLDLDIMQWALGGKLNTQLVAQAKHHEVTAVGISGTDASTLQVTKRPPWTVNGKQVDFGWVGDVEGVDTALIEGLLTSGFMPIVAPLGIDSDGQIYNVNADTVAQALASALEADRLLLVTGTGGVRRSAEAAETRLDVCDFDTYAAGLAEGWIEGGMRVKLKTAFDALENGVEQAYILAPDDLTARSKATRVEL